MYLGLSHRLGVVVFPASLSTQSATMLVPCSNVTVSVKKFTCASVRLEWSLDQLGRHINIVIIIIIIIIISFDPSMSRTEQIRVQESSEDLHRTLSQ